APDFATLPQASSYTSRRSVSRASKSRRRRCRACSSSATGRATTSMRQGTDYLPPPSCIHRRRIDSANHAEFGSLAPARQRRSRWHRDHTPSARLNSCPPTIKPTLEIEDYETYRQKWRDNRSAESKSRVLRSYLLASFNLSRPSRRSRGVRSEIRT